MNDRPSSPLPHPSHLAQPPQVAAQPAAPAQFAATPDQDERVPAKKGRSSLFIGLSVVFVVLSVVGSCSAWFYLSTKEEVSLANDLLAALQAQDYVAAERMLSPSCSSGSLEEIKEFFGASEITDYRITGATIRNNGLVYADGTLTINGDDQRIVSVGSDDTGICGLRIGAFGETSGEPGTGG